MFYITLHFTFLSNGYKLRIVNASWQIIPTMEVLLAQFSLYVHMCGLNPYSINSSNVSDCRCKNSFLPGYKVLQLFRQIPALKFIDFSSTSSRDSQTWHGLPL